MVTKYKRGKIWYLSWYEGKKRKQKSAQTTSKEIAEQLRRIKERELLLGHTITKELSIDELLSNYQKTVAAKYKEKTAQRYTEIIAHIQKYFKTSNKIAVSEVDRLDIESYIIWRKGYNVSQSTICNELTLFQQIWNFAIDIGSASNNPVKKTPRPKVPKGKQPRFLKKEEIPVFLKELKKTAPHYFWIAKFTLYTGLRRSEILQLKWEDINFGQMKLRVKDGKGDKSRDIPIHPMAKTALDSYYEEFGKGREKSGLVFLSLKGTPLTRGKLYTSFIRAGRRAGLKGNIGVHTLRHTFATHLAMANVPVRTLQDYMGHSKIETTMIYLHLAESHWESEIQKLDFEWEL